MSELRRGEIFSAHGALLTIAIESSDRVLRRPGFPQSCSTVAGAASALLGREHSAARGSAMASELARAARDGSREELAGLLEGVLGLVRGRSGGGLLLGLIARIDRADAASSSSVESS